MAADLENTIYMDVPAGRVVIEIFIMFAPETSLDGKYTIWGTVVSGMDNIDKIKKGDPARNGTVTNPDKIIKMQVAADAEKKS